MKNKISKEWLEEKRACKDGIEWFTEQDETDGVKVVAKLITQNQLKWANWLIVRIMDYKMCVRYAVYAAEQVIDIFEQKYPNDKRPRRAIEAAKLCIDNPSAENRKNAAAASAYSAAASYAAAYSAAYAAAAAAADYYAASYAAAYEAAFYAAYDAYDDDADKAKMLLKITKYGLSLLGEVGNDHTER